MPTISFPRRYVVVLDELAARVLDTHKHDDTHTVARDLLAGFFDICMRSGLDGVLHELAEALPSLDMTDRQGLIEHASVGPAFVAAVAAQNLDGGGPRNTKPRLLAESLLATLSLVVVDESDRTITLGDDVRTAVVAALTGAVDVELAVPRIRETVIALARAACEPQFHAAFDRIAEHLDERGMKIVKQPKVPLHAVQAVQHALSNARLALLDRVARAAIDRAKEVLARAEPDAAARIDQPISYRLTPRDAAVIRAGEPRVPRQPAAVAQSLLDSLTELAQLAWRPAERPVRAYAASQTFTVGELLEHPKFGRGSVTACSAQRIDVEFADGPHTLVHVGKRG